MAPRGRLRHPAPMPGCLRIDLRGTGGAQQSGRLAMDTHQFPGLRIALELPLDLGGLLGFELAVRVSRKP